MMRTHRCVVVESLAAMSDAVARSLVRTVQSLVRHIERVDAPSNIFGEAFHVVSWRLVT